MEVNELSYGQTRHVVQLLSRLGENKILANMIINSTQIEVKEKLREMGGFTTLDAWRISKIMSNRSCCGEIFQQPNDEGTENDNQEQGAADSATTDVVCDGGDCCDSLFINRSCMWRNLYFLDGEFRALLVRGEVLPTDEKKIEIRALQASLQLVRNIAGHGLNDRLCLAEGAFKCRGLSRPDPQFR